MRLINARTNGVVAEEVEVAATRHARRTGLLGRDALDPSSALVLDPCWMIHTAFMRFSIDVVFVGRDGRVIRIAPALPPWRAAAAPRAHRVIELPAGAAGRHGIRTGDCVRLC